jgi:hypothetical protein
MIFCLRDDVQHDLTRSRQFAAMLAQTRFES